MKQWNFRSRRISTEENETNTSDEQSHRTSISSLSKIPEEVSTNENFSSTQNNGKHIIIVSLSIESNIEIIDHFLNWRQCRNQDQELIDFIETLRAKFVFFARFQLVEVVSRVKQIIIVEGRPFFLSNSQRFLHRFSFRHQIESLSSENHQSKADWSFFLEPRKYFDDFLFSWRKLERRKFYRDSIEHWSFSVKTSQTRQRIAWKSTGKKFFFLFSPKQIVKFCFFSLNQIALATTTLTDESWVKIELFLRKSNRHESVFLCFQEDLLKFLRHFPESQLSLNLNVNDSTTHLIVDDHESNLHCTITKKVVQAAVRRHIFIISHRWLNECVEKKSLVDEQTFEIVSDSHTTMRTSAQNFDKINKFIFPSNSTVLYAFAIECRQCQGSINRAELVELIHLTGAQLFQEDQAVDVLIVLCDINDRSLTKIKEKYAEAPASSIKFVASDFLLKTIVKFEIQDIEKYALWV